MDRAQYAGLPFDPDELTMVLGLNGWLQKKPQFGVGQYPCN